MNNRSMDFELSDQDGGGGGGNIIAQLPAILAQRKMWVIIPAILGVIGAGLAAMLLPTTYQSKAVMLVQSPSLPRDVIGTEASEFVDQRIERIRQQVVNRPALVSLIETHQLYPGDRGSTPLSEIIDEMREAIVLMPTTLEDASNRPEDRTIAFNLTFDYEDAKKSQTITQKLMERIIELNSTSNTAQMTQTVQFLQDQATDLERQIAEVESQISTMNSQYGNELSNSGGMIIGSNTSSYDVQIGQLQKENTTLASQREIARTSDVRDPNVASAEAQLAAVRATYAETHPDVMIARQRLEEARALAARNVRKMPSDTIDRQIAFNNAQIASLRSAKAQEEAQIRAAVVDRAKGPMIQQQVTQLQQKLDGFYKQYEGVSQRLLSAKAGEKADDEQMGERLVVVDPPVVPDTPIKPDRPLLFGIGSAAGLGLGLVLAMLVEMFLQPIRDPSSITAVTGGRPLAIVPVIKPMDFAIGSGGSWFASLRQKIFRNPFRRATG